MKTVKLSAVVKKLDLHVVRTSSDYETIEITNSEINRPGLQLSGFLEEFPYRRIQLFGKAELAYYMAMDMELRKERVRAMMEYDIPCIVFSHYAQIPDEVRKLAEEYDKTLLISDRTTTRLISALDEVLEYFLSEEDTIHASLLDVFGMGVLLMGDSSVGKSETALDLVTRGHRLVADDVVEIRKIEKGLLAQAPLNIRHYLEVRGLGILDIQRLYGTGSVRLTTFIDLVIKLEKWQDDKEYDRIGLDDHTTEILGVELPYLEVPVKPGRNIAMIVEVAVRNQRQKLLGYNAAQELNDKLIANMKKDTEEHRKKLKNNKN